MGVSPSIVPFLHSKRTAAARSLVSLIESERFVAVLSELAVELPCRGLARAFLYLLDRRENTHIFLIIGACLRFLVLRTYVVFKNRAFYRGLAHALLYLSRREKTINMAHFSPRLEPSTYARACLALSRVSGAWTHLYFWI